MSRLRAHLLSTVSLTALGVAALASEASGQRGHFTVRAPDTRPEPGSSARAAPAAMKDIGRALYDAGMMLGVLPGTR